MAECIGQPGILDAERGAPRLPQSIAGPSRRWRSGSASASRGPESTCAASPPTVTTSTRSSSPPCSPRPPATSARPRRSSPCSTSSTLQHRKNNTTWQMRNDRRQILPGPWTSPGPPGSVHAESAPRTRCSKGPRTPHCPSSGALLRQARPAAPLPDEKTGLGRRTPARRFSRGCDHPPGDGGS